jgi:hypothetical protein
MTVDPPYHGAGARRQSHAKMKIVCCSLFTMHLILYAKPGCHLCEGLEEKLRSLTQPLIQLEIRDITTQPEWFAAYQYEIPVLFYVAGSTEIPIPRPSPRASTAQLAQLLQKHLESDR